MKPKMTRTALVSRLTCRYEARRTIRLVRGASATSTEGLGGVDAGCALIVSPLSPGLSIDLCMLYDVVLQTAQYVKEMRSRARRHIWCGCVIRHACSTNTHPH